MCQRFVALTFLPSLPEGAVPNSPAGSKFSVVVSWYEILGIFQFTSQAAHLWHDNEAYGWLLALIFGSFMTAPVKLKLNYGVGAVMIVLLRLIGKVWGRKDCFTLVKIASKLGKLFPWQRLTDIWRPGLRTAWSPRVASANWSTWDGVRIRPSYFPPPCPYSVAQV